MSNNFEPILLNENKKIYSFIRSNDETYEYELSISKNLENSDKTLFIQIYSFTGNANMEVNLQLSETNPKIENYNDFNNYYNYNNNTILYIYNINKNN